MGKGKAGKTKIIQPGNEAGIDYKVDGDTPECTSGEKKKMGCATCYCSNEGQWLCTGLCPKGKELLYIVINVNYKYKTRLWWGGNGQRKYERSIFVICLIYTEIYIII